MCIVIYCCSVITSCMKWLQVVAKKLLFEREKELRSYIASVTGFKLCGCGHSAFITSIKVECCFCILGLKNVYMYF